MTTAGEEVDPAAIAASLGVESATRFKVMKGGWDNSLWLFGNAERQRRVLRLFRVSGSLEETRAAAENEALAMSLAREAGLPVPAVVAQGLHEGIPAAVHEWMPGQTLADKLKGWPTRARVLGRAMGRLQAQVHGCPVTGLRPLAAFDWDERLDDPALAAAARDAISDELRFCHLDFHPFNLLVQGREISALLDFRNAAAGDRRVDLGLTWALLTAPPLPRGMQGRAVQAVIRRLAAGWREGYTEAAGEFPLTPLFEAVGLAAYRTEFLRARNDGRGWATKRDISRLTELLDERKTTLGIR